MTVHAVKYACVAVNGGTVTVPTDPLGATTFPAPS